jgi:hypothetical protein
MFRIIFLLISLFWFVFAKSQELKIRVINAHNKSPLAFVNIKFDKQQKGVSTDIDGYFILKSKECCSTISLSYIGYKDTVIAINKLKNKGIISLAPSAYQLEAVDILPGENPAFKIIRKLIEHKKSNDPEKLKSFSYKAYHKFVATADPESIRNAISDTSHLDSSLIRMSEFFSSQHLMIIESVSKRYHKAPNKNKETILATRVSGLSDPSFAFLSSQLQSFSFYKPSIDILDKHYINPLTKSSLNRYFYLLEDSIFSDFDTTYIISFRPYKGTNFDGLKGQVHISTHNFAIKNVIAEPADSAVDIGIKIQQKYELIDNKYWFPTQLNSDLIFYGIVLNQTFMKGIGRSYLRNIEINKDFDKKVRFNNIVLEMPAKASKAQSSIFWNENRINPLDSQDLKTYKVIDSIGKAEHLDQKLWVYTSLLNGKIPMGPIDMELDKFIQYNDFEGFRFGLGLITNDRLSRFIQLGGYGAWATKDYRWKYGGNINFNLWTQRELKIKFAYQNDVFESAKQYNFGEKSIFNMEMLRDFIVSKMVYHKTLDAEIAFRALPHSSWNLGFNYSQINSPDDYQFVITNDDNNYAAKGDFNIAELNAGVRFAYKEKLMANKSDIISLGTKFPVLNIHYTKAIDGIFNSELNYEKLDLQLDYSYYIRFLGKTSWRISAGKTFGNAPWYKLYNGKGSYLPFYADAPYSFGTMRVNEFLSEEYLALFLRHDFGTLLFGEKRFIPRPSFVSSFTIGQLNHPELHNNIHYKTLEKGYYESGILLNSILKSGISNIGFGIFYRYGSYAFDKVEDNFSYKFTIQYSL